MPAVFSSSTAPKRCSGYRLQSSLVSAHLLCSLLHLGLHAASFAVELQAAKFKFTTKHTINLQHAVYVYAYAHMQKILISAELLD